MSQGKKRAASAPIVGSKRSGSDGRVVNTNNDENHDEDEMEIEEIDGMEFEDPYGDEFDDESLEDNDIEEVDHFDDDEEPEKTGQTEDVTTAEEDEGPKLPSKQVWRPGIDKVPEGEELEYDPSAYIMYHCFRTEWPCLSFDFLRDNLGDNRLRFPHSMFLVTGSQADVINKNKVTLLHVKDLHRTFIPDDSDSEGDNDHDDHDDDDLDEDPTLDYVNITHRGAVNRIRAMPQQAGIIATMSETAALHIFDLTAITTTMMNKTPRPMIPTGPVFTSTCHKSEGYALDWSLTTAGRLASGDCHNQIFIQDILNMTGTGNSTAGSAYTGHTNSVEDLQWSPSEDTVFASASSDHTVRIWDTRARNRPQITFTAHDADVNVITWNRMVSYLLASGGDEGGFKVWDLRSVASQAKLPSGPRPLAHFTYHTGAVTSIEWSPHDESMLTVSSADDQVSLWDLSVEAEDSSKAASTAVEEYPPQLLFLHLGQKEVKEVHFHPQIPGALVSTAEDAFNVFKPAITVST